MCRITIHLKRIKFSHFVLRIFEFSLESEWKNSQVKIGPCTFTSDGKCVSCLKESCQQMFDTEQVKISKIQVKYKISYCCCFCFFHSSNRFIASWNRHAAYQPSVNIMSRMLSNIHYETPTQHEEHNNSRAKLCKKKQRTPLCSVMFWSHEFSIISILRRNETEDYTNGYNTKKAETY